MKAHFQVDFIEDGNVVGSAAADNILLDAGIAALINANNDLFYAPTILVGSSDVTPEQSQPGLLAGFGSSDSQSKTRVSVCNVDDDTPYVNFGVSAFFDDLEANGSWSEISLNGWNRALISALGTMTDGDKHYMVTSFNDFGESTANIPKLVTLSSPAIASQLSATQGLTSFPHKISVDNKDASQDDIVTMSFKTLSWAVNVSGCFRNVYAKRPARSEKSWSISFSLKRDGLYYYNWLGKDYVLSPQPIAGTSFGYSALLSDGESVEWIATMQLGPWPGPSGGQWTDGNGNFYNEATFWQSIYQGGPLDSGSFDSVFKSYYKIVSQNHGLLTGSTAKKLGGGIGRNLTFMAPDNTRYAYDLIGRDVNDVDPIHYPPERDEYQPFTTFWGWDNKLFDFHGAVLASNTVPFSGELFDCPYFALRMWEGLGIPYIDDTSQFTIKASGKTGGVFLKWEHVTAAGPGGWPKGYRVYRQKDDTTYGLLKEIPALFDIEPGETKITGHGQTYVWDNGETVLGPAPHFSFSGPLPPDPTKIQTEAKAGLVPKTFVKTNKMQARVNVQIYFYDLNTSQATQVKLTPTTRALRAGESVSFSATPSNDYGDQVPGVINWSAPDGGVITPSLDTFSASFTHNKAGSYQIVATDGPLSASGSAIVSPNDVALISFLDALPVGNSSSNLNYSWNTDKTALTVTYPQLVPLDGTSFSIAMNGFDQYANDAGVFSRNFSMDGVSQREVNTDGTYGVLSEVDNATFTLKTDGSLILKQPGTVIIEIREIINNRPATYSKLLTINFEWR